MSAIFYAFIILPVIFISFLSFVFQTSLSGIQNTQFLANCPMPLNSAVATITDINGIRVIYTITYENSTTLVKNTQFVCEVVDPDIPLYGASTIVTEYSGSLINDQIAWFGYAGNMLTAFFDRAYHSITMLWLMINAPAEVTGLVFFTYIYAILFGFIIIGAYMLLRGGF